MYTYVCIYIYIYTHIYAYMHAYMHVNINITNKYTMINVKQTTIKHVFLCACDNGRGSPSWLVESDTFTGTRPAQVPAWYKEDLNIIYNCYYYIILQFTYDMIL